MVRFPSLGTWKVVAWCWKTGMAMPSTCQPYRVSPFSSPSWAWSRRPLSSTSSEFTSRLAYQSNFFDTLQWCPSEKCNRVSSWKLHYLFWWVKIIDSFILSLLFLHLNRGSTTLSSSGGSWASCLTTCPFCQWPASSGLPHWLSSWLTSTRLASSP